MKLKIFLTIMLAHVFCTASFTQPVIQSQKVYGGNNYDGFKVSVSPLENGGFIIGGHSYSNKSGDKTQNTRGSGDYWIIKTNKKGQKLWDKTFGGNGDDNFKSVIQTADGGFALIGESDSNTSGEKDEDSRGFTDYWIVKLDKKEI